MTSASALEEANAKLTLRLHQQELTAAFANFGLQTDALQPVLDEACRVASNGMECRFAKVLQYLPDDDCFLMRAGIGWNPGVVGHARLGSDLASPAGFAFRTGQPVLSNHLAMETRFRTPALLLEHGVHRAFNVLIHTPEGRYGVLEVDSPDQRKFSIPDIAFLESLAVTLANAIAKQKRLDSLHDNAAFIKSVLDASPDCIKVINPEGVIEMINAGGLSLLEIDDVSKVVGRNWQDLWPERERETLRAAVAAARAGIPGRFEAFAPTVTGSPKWWDVQITRITGVEGKLLAISRDVTERVAAGETKDLLMLEIHHRVKNSLQLVQNLLSLQGRASDNEQASTQLLESAARVRTIAAIHDRLYKVGSALTVDIGPYMEGLVEDLRDGMASALAGRSIRVEADEVIWPAQEVPTLGLVLTELVTNALKYGAGTVHVTFRQPPGSNGILTVWDEGPGVPDDFDPGRSRGLGMRLVMGLLRSAPGGLQIERRGGHVSFIAHMPPRRGMSS